MTFNRVLIANRGEIALRAIEACRELSLETVAVFSQADRHMPYLRLADSAVCIGPPNQQRSYLNIPSMISAAEVVNAQAVYPGYGFLAENSHFVEVCEDHGITFVGPDQQSIELAGNKFAARDAVAEVGVPILPGELAPKSEQELLPAAERIGFPLFVKSTFGGGGRGMRKVDEPTSLTTAVRAARSEAQSACGSDSLYLEKAVDNPRHIEVQILADNKGKIIHLGERECSIQRRHQKLIEEAPAPFIDEMLRQELHSAAVDAARAINYHNAGTVEFVVDRDDRFSFIEMNARIQVEHPISEMITGYNLVKEQLRIAGGGSLHDWPIDTELVGHAIECRINAEDPDDNFLPSCGTIHIRQLPTGHGVRLDTHLYNGMEITPHYDSLIAKLITWGRSREEARTRMACALEMFQVEGIATTVGVMLDIINHRSFRKGDIETSFLAKLESS